MNRVHYFEEDVFLCWFQLTEELLGQDAALFESSIMPKAETHAIMKENVDEEQRSNSEHHMTENAEEENRKIEHLCPSTSYYRIEDSWSEAAGFFAPDTSYIEETLSSSDHQQSDSESECSDVDLDNNWVESEHCDSDASFESLESRKQNKWLRPFFNMLDDTGTDPTDNHEKYTLFYCPACRGSGLGETDVYKGLKPLIVHAKYHTKRRVKLHREFAAILEEDLERRCIMTTEPSSANASCKQMGLIEDEKLMNQLIVWPPMVLLESKGVELDAHHKRAGMGSKELLEIFKEYHPRRVRHAYDPTDHFPQLSLLIFPDSPVGYMHAKRLAKNFKVSRRGREQCHELEALKSQSYGDGLLYGYMATDMDMLVFNTQDASKKKVKWDSRRYQEVVMQPMVEMQEAKLENKWLRAKLLEQEEHNKFLEKVMCKLHANLELKEEEVCVTREIARKQDDVQRKENILQMNEPEQTCERRVHQMDKMP
eukprot:c627_g1_i2 orf=33-1481(+)